MKGEVKGKQKAPHLAGLRPSSCGLSPRCLLSAGRYGSGSEHTPDDRGERECKNKHAPILGPFGLLLCLFSVRGGDATYG